MAAIISKQKRRRIGITSIGVVSSVGVGVEEFWAGLIGKRSGMTTIKSFDTSGVKYNKGCEIQELAVPAYLGEKGLRHLDKVTVFLLIASHLALHNRIDHSEMGVVVGTAFSGLHSIFEFERLALKDGTRSINPMDFPNTVINAPASRINIKYGMSNLSETISTGMASGTDAIGYAGEYIKKGENNAILCGGGEELNEESLYGAYLIKLLSGLDPHGNPEPCCRPFDKARDGIVLGEGAALVVVESIEQAKEKGKKILAEIVGFGSTFNGNPHHNGSVDCSGPQRAIEGALREAQLSPGDVDYICASANGSREDRTEAAALEKIFGSRMETIPVGTIKSQVGECFGATGAMQTAAAVMSLNRNLLPPTLNFDEAEDGLGRLNISRDAVKKDVNICLINSFSNYGHNSSLLIKKYD